MKDTVSRGISGGIHVHCVPKLHLKLWPTELQDWKKARQETVKQNHTGVWIPDKSMSHFPPVPSSLWLMLVKDPLTINYLLTQIVLHIFFIPLFYFYWTQTGKVSPTFWIDGIVQRNASQCDTFMKKILSFSILSDRYLAKELWNGETQCQNSRKWGFILNSQC